MLFRSDLRDSSFGLRRCGGLLWREGRGRGTLFNILLGIIPVGLRDQHVRLCSGREISSTFSARLVGEYEQCEAVVSRELKSPDEPLCMKTESAPKVPVFRRSREILPAMHPWMLTNLLGGFILLAGIISLVWSSDMSWPAHSSGNERAGILGTSDGDRSPMECGERKVSHILTEVADIR